MLSLLFFLFTVNAAALTLKKTSDPNALCLDGSPGSYYIETNSSSTVWVLQIQGGGWCYDEAACLGRSKTSLGSSTKLASSFTGTGVLSDKASVNGDLAAANKVHLNYCDGASFSGTRKDPLVVNGTGLHMRGHYILHAIWKDLLTSHGMEKATHILVAGTSAGALATFLHADELASLAPPSTVVFKAMPQSGYFLDIANVDGTPVYGPELRYVATMQEARGGLPAACVAAAANWTDCIFAPNVVPTLTTDTFVINSANDEWQMGNEWTVGSSDAAAHALRDCLRHPDKCTAAALGVSDAFIAPFMTTWKTSLARRPSAKGISAFIHSCLTHVQSRSDEGWSTMAIAGHRLADLVAAWFFADEASLTLDPCLNAPHGYPCNPMCDAVDDEVVEEWK
jgi:hypothetical protein